MPTENRNAQTSPAPSAPKRQLRTGAAHSVQTGNAARPAQPAQPVQGARPAQPVQPAQPVRASQSAASAVRPANASAARPAADIPKAAADPARVTGPAANAPGAAAPARISAVNTARAAVAAPPRPAGQSTAPAPRREAVPEPERAFASPAKKAAKPKKERPKRDKKPLHPVLAGLLAIGRGILLVVGIAFRLALLAPIPLFLLWYSFTIDRNGWFQGEQYAREIATAMLGGQYVSNSEMINEREVTKLYVQNLDAAPHSVALGSSRILQLHRSIVGDETFYNTGMVGAEYPDVYSSYYLFDRVGLTPDMVIFGVDPWLFSSGVDANTFKRVDMDMWNEYLHFAMGREDIEVTVALENMNFWLALTSPAFFHETMDYYIDNKENGLRPAVLPEEEIYDQPGDTKRPDGSFLYSRDFRERDQEQIDFYAYYMATVSLVNCEEFYELDAEHVEMFDRFVQYMQRSGSDVVFFLSPYHPDAYAWFLNFPVRYSGFFQVETWLRQYAAQHGIPVYGSYDPLACGCENTDFFDAWHVRDTGIAKYFPGVPAVEAAFAAGTLPDPLATQPRLPTATEDLVL